MAVNFGTKEAETTVKDTGSTLFNNVDTGANLPSVADSNEQASLSLMNCKQRYEEEIRASGLIDQLTSEIVLSDSTSIVHFGSQSAKALSSVADVIISTYDTKQIEQTGSMMHDIADIMQRFNKNELENIDKSGGFLDRLFKRTQNKINELLNKYNTIKGDLDRICTQLNVYDAEIQKSNKDIAIMYDANVETYKQLVAYIIAGEDALKQVDDYRSQLEVEIAGNGDPTATLELQQVDQARQLLVQRIKDLQTVEAVTLQSLPLLKSKEWNNALLSRKIQSAFITTLPIFKNAIAQALMSKQQEMQAQALGELDAVTAEMWQKNVDKSVENMKMSTKLAGQSAISPEQLEQAWTTIVNGVTETRKLSNEIEQKNRADIQKLKDMNMKFLAQASGVN